MFGNYGINLGLANQALWNRQTVEEYGAFSQLSDLDLYGSTAHKDGTKLLPDILSRSSLKLSKQAEIERTISGSSYILLQFVLGSCYSWKLTQRMLLALASRRLRDSLYVC